MEENENLEQQENELFIADELMKEIEAQVKELRTNNPKLKAIYPIVVEGNVEYGEKERIVAYFRQPTFMVFSKYLTASQKNQAVGMRELAKDCFLAGDRELIDDDSLFLFGLMPQISKIIEMRHGKLVNLSTPGK